MQRARQGAPSPPSLRQRMRGKQPPWATGEDPQAALEVYLVTLSAVRVTRKCSTDEQRTCRGSKTSKRIWSDKVNSNRHSFVLFVDSVLENCIVKPLARGQPSRKTDYGEAPANRNGTTPAQAHEVTPDILLSARPSPAIPP